MGADCIEDLHVQGGWERGIWSRDKSKISTNCHDMMRSHKNEIIFSPFFIACFIIVSVLFLP